MALRAAILLVVAFLLACGGGGRRGGSSSKGGGGVLFTVKWPARTAGESRVIPTTAETIRFDFETLPNHIPLKDNPLYPPLQRPFGDAGGTATYTRRNLPSGRYAVTIVARPKSVAEVPVAMGHGVIEIRGDETTKVTIALGSTVRTLDVKATGGATLVPVGGTASLEATPRDESGHMVLVGTSTVTWKSSDPTVATVDATGLTPTVRALKKGSVTFTATFNEVEPTVGQVPVVSPLLSLTVISLNLYQLQSNQVGDEYQSSIVRSNIDGSGIVVLYQFALNLDVDDITVSPDGSRIACVYDDRDAEENNRYILVIDGTGGVVAQYSDSRVSKVGMVLGANYLYRLQHRQISDELGVYDIVRSRIDGSEQAILFTSGTRLDFDAISVSSDESRIAFVYDDEDAPDESRRRIGVIDGQGRSVANYLAPEVAKIGLAVAPSVLYRLNSLDMQEHAYSISRTNLDGSNATVLFQTATESDVDSIALSPDGSLIAFVYDDEDEPDESNRHVVILNSQGNLLRSFVSNAVTKHGCRLAP